MAVSVKQQGTITLIGIDRAEARNAVDRPTAEALAEAFRAFESDEEARVAVFHGHGGTFCAGADLKAFADDQRRNRLEEDGDGPMGVSRMALTKPVIGAINGFAVAGGLELALWCDLRVVEEDATFGVFCRRWGVPLIDGGTVRLPRIVGMGRALDMIMTGRPVGAEEALQMGLANRITPNGKALETAIELAEQIAAFPQACMKSDRLSAYEQQGLSLEDAMKSEFSRSIGMVEAEGKSGAAQFADGAGRGGKFK